MQSVTLLARFRRYLTSVAIFTYIIWLTIAILPMRSAADCCGGISGISSGNGASTSDDCDQGSCEEGMRRVEVTFDNTEVRLQYNQPDGQIWSWNYTIRCDGLEIENGTGVVTTSNPKNFSICVPEDKKVEVDIVPQEPHPYTPQYDPLAKNLPGTLGGTGSNTNDHEVPSINPPTITPTTPKSESPCVLNFKWCSPCGEGSDHCASEKKSNFTVSSGCSVGPGQACAKKGSVNFQINLGRDSSGKPVRLILRQKDITSDSYTPLRVEFPAVTNRYQMEIWHWFEWEHEVFVDTYQSPNPIVSGGMEGRASGRRYIFNYTGKDGYKALFAQMGVAPVGRSVTSTAGVQVPQLPSNVHFEEHDPADHTLGAFNYAGGLNVMVPTGPANHLLHVYDDRVKVLDNVWNGEYLTMRAASHVGERSGSIDQNPTSPNGSIDDYVRGHLSAVINTPLVAESRWVAWVAPSPVDHYDFAGQFIRNLNGSMAEIPLKYNGVRTHLNGTPDAYGFFNANQTGSDPAPIINATYNVQPMPATSDTIGDAASDTGGSATLGPEVCVETIPDGTNGYTIYAYWRSQLTFIYSGPDKGTYHITGSPFAAWRVKQVVENEGQLGASPVVGSLRIEERRVDPTNPAAVDAWYEWRQNGANWVMNTNKGLRRDIESTSPLNGGERRIVQVREMGSVSAPFCTVESQSGAILSHHETITNDKRQVVEETDGVGAEALVTTHHFDGEGKRYGYSRNDGSFEYHRVEEDENGRHELVVRPWGNTVFGPVMTNAQGAATETVTTTVNGITTETQVEYILSHEMARTVTVSKNIPVTHLSYRDAQPAREVKTTSYSSARPGIVQETVRQTYLSHAVPSLAGQIAYERRADGSSTIYHYFPRGKFDAGTGAFYQGQGNYRQVWTQNLVSGLSGDAAIPFVTTNTITVYDPEDRVVEQRVCVVGDDGKNKLVDITRSDFDRNGQETTSFSNRAATTSTVYDTAGRLESRTDQTGSQTTYSNYDANGNPQTETQQGYPAEGDLAAIPPRVTQLTYDALGRVKRTTRGSLASEQIYNSRGRVVADIKGTSSGGPLSNVRTVTRSYTYLANGGGVKETVNNNGQAFSETVTLPDGQTHISGPGVIASSVTKELVGSNDPSVPGSIADAGTAILEKTFVGTNVDTELAFATVSDGRGRTLGEYTFACDSNGNRVGSWRSFEYDTADRVIGEFVDGVRTLSTVYGIPGNRIDTIHAAPSPDQLRAQVRYLWEKANGEWWEVISSTAGTQKTRISHLGRGGSILSESVFVDTEGNTTSQSSTAAILAPGTVTYTANSPGVSNPAVSVTRGGLVQSTSSPAGDQTTFQYDTLGRQTKIISAGNIVTDVDYHNIFNSVEFINIHGNTIGQSASTITQYTYYPPSSASAGKLASMVREAQSGEPRTTYYSYTPRGEIKAEWGSAYPVRYDYDHAGRLKYLYTYRTPQSSEPTSGGDGTTWVYRHGSLWKKIDAAGKAVIYGYDGRARLNYRKWARGVETAYTYDNADALASKTYSDTASSLPTPPVLIERDDLGRIVTAGSGANQKGDIRYEYIGATGNVWYEKQGQSYLKQGGYSQLYRSYDGLGRATVSEMYMDGSYWPNISPNVYGFHGQWNDYSGATGLLNGVSGDVALTYSPGTSRLVNVNQDAGVGGLALIDTQYTPDGIGRIKRVETFSDAASRSFTEYSYVNGLRKTVNTDRGVWSYDYDSREQLIGGKKMSGTQNVPGYQWTYAYDDIGNRKSAETNGDFSYFPSSGAANNANSLNQPSQRTVPGKIYVRGQVFGVGSGATPNSATARIVSPGHVWQDARPFVNGAFAKSLDLDNASGPRRENVEVEASSSDITGEFPIEYNLKQQRQVVLPQSPEVFVYDDDGNLTQDGLWKYTWDAENRLVEMIARPEIWPGGVYPTGFQNQRLRFAYDWLGRRIIKQVLLADGVSLKKMVRFCYDGWNLKLEKQIDWNTPIDITGDDWSATVGGISRGYTWGPDLSGSMQGAGGVGGLLRVTGYRPGETLNLIPAYDGNGNVMSYLSAITGEIVQEEEYGPFGENLRPRSTNELRCPIGWSSKYMDEETGLLYYGYRYYSPNLGRWINRDPSEESGGVNLYSFISNRTGNGYDYLGLWKGPHRLGQNRAKIYAQCGDKISDLEDILKLNPEQYKAWLKAEDGKGLPGSEKETIKERRVFSVPNVAYIDVAAYGFGWIGTHTLALKSQIQKNFSAAGLNVVHTGTWGTTKKSIISHLESDDISAFVYIGHGSESGSLVLGRNGGLFDFVGSPAEEVFPTKYTKFGITYMQLMSCTSDNKQWRKNVSRKGLLKTTIAKIGCGNVTEKDAWENSHGWDDEIDGQR